MPERGRRRSREEEHLADLVKSERAGRLEVMTVEHGHF